MSTRLRAAGVPASPLHVPGGLPPDIDRPTVTRMAEAAALCPRDPLLDEAVLIVSEMLDGDGPGRLHRARNIVQALVPTFEQAADRRAADALVRRADATTTLMRAARAGGVDASTAAWFAAIAIDALSADGHL